MFVVGTSWPALSGDLCGFLEVGALWAEGLGFPTYSGFLSSHLCSACAPGTDISHHGGSLWGQGTPQGCTRRLLGCFGGQVLPCAMPGPERVLLPRQNPGLESGCHPGQQVPPELPGRWHGVRLRINPGCQGKQGAGAENIPSLTLAFAYHSGLARSGERGHSPAA